MISSKKKYKFTKKRMFLNILIRLIKQVSNRNTKMWMRFRFDFCSAPTHNRECESRCTVIINRVGSFVIVLHSNERCKPYVDDYYFHHFCLIYSFTSTLCTAASMQIDRLVVSSSLFRVLIATQKRTRRCEHRRLKVTEDVIAAQKTFSLELAIFCIFFGRRQMLCHRYDVMSLLSASNTKKIIHSK